jgi:hypothetical protein
MSAYKLLRTLLAHAGIFGLFEGDPSGGNANPPPPAPPAPQPQSFSAEYVRELREESKGYRLKAQETEQQKKAAEEKATAAETAAAAKIAEATSAADKRVIRAELKAEALKAGMIDLDGLQLADLSAVKLNDKGEVEGGTAAIEALKKAKPYLFGATSTSTPGNPPRPAPNAGAKVVDLSPEEYRKRKAAAIAGR